jgi:hypothetical protein
MAPLKITSAAGIPDFANFPLQHESSLYKLIVHHSRNASALAFARKSALIPLLASDEQLAHSSEMQAPDQFARDNLSEGEHTTSALWYINPAGAQNSNTIGDAAVSPKIIGSKVCLQSSGLGIPSSLRIGKVECNFSRIRPRAARSGLARSCGYPGTGRSGTIRPCGRFTGDMDCESISNSGPDPTSRQRSHCGAREVEAAGGSVRNEGSGHPDGFQAGTGPHW